MKLPPDWIIEEEIERRQERRRREIERQRPQLEVPRNLPYWPEPVESPRDDETRDGVIIIKM